MTDTTTTSTYQAVVHREVVQALLAREVLHDSGFDGAHDPVALWSLIQQYVAAADKALYDISALWSATRVGIENPPLRGTKLATSRGE